MENTLTNVFSFSIAAYLSYSMSLLFEKKFFTLEYPELLVWMSISLTAIVYFGVFERGTFFMEVLVNVTSINLLFTFVLLVKAVQYRSVKKGKGV